MMINGLQWLVICIFSIINDGCSMVFVVLMFRKNAGKTNTINKLLF